MRWINNYLVAIANNYFTVKPVSNTERLVKSEHRRTAKQPHNVKMYIQGMSGMNVCDCILSSYQPWLRSWKWWNLFSNRLNLSVVAVFRFYSYANHTKITHHQFRREMKYLVKAEEARLHLGGLTVQPITTVRYDSVNHTMKSVSQERCFLPKHAFGFNMKHLKNDAIRNAVLCSTHWWILSPELLAFAAVSCSGCFAFILL